MFIILVYDIKEKRVAKALKICRKYLTWVQNSVFEGDITIANRKKLQAELKKMIEPSEDSILIYQFQSKKYYTKETIGITKNETSIFF